MNKENLVKLIKDVFSNANTRFIEIMIDLIELQSNKNKDYAMVDMPWRNFTTVGDALEKYNIITKGNAPMKVALTYAYKQWDSILKMLGREEKGNVESITDKLKDIAVYSVIAIILNEES